MGVDPVLVDLAAVLEVVGVADEIAAGWVVAADEADVVVGDALGSARQSVSKVAVKRRNRVCMRVHSFSCCCFHCSVISRLRQCGERKNTQSPERLRVEKSGIS